MLKILKKILLKLISLVNVYSKVSYSQHGEDLILRNFLPQNRGFYVDIGANHPFRFSNTYYFYLLGWRGINIEPNPELIKKLNKHRSRDINLEIGISNKKSLLKYYLFDDPALNTFSKKRAKELIKAGIYQNIAEKKIKVVGLAETLDSYLPDGQRVDFMSIDVESLDLNVLQSNNWNKYRPQYILIEELEGKKTIEAYLKKQNYKKVTEIHKNILFRDNFN